MKGYTILIKKNNTQEVAEHVDLYDWPSEEDLIFWWDEGNGACDCNRERYFNLEKRIDDKEVECGDKNFSIRILKNEKVLLNQFEDS